MKRLHALGLLPLALLAMGAFGLGSGCGSNPDGHNFADCSELEDQETQQTNIVVENARSTPIYFAASDFCSGGVSAPVTDADGNVVSGWAGCGATCDEKMNSGNFGCAEPGGDCAGGGLTMLGPGARTIVTWHGGVYRTTTLQSDCAEPPQVGQTCQHLVPAPEGVYAVKVDAFTSATCDSFDGRGEHPCICTPSTVDSTCQIFDSFTPGEAVSAEVEFDFPTTSDVVIRIQ